MSDAEKPTGVLVRFARLVRIAHTVFALPFAMSGLALATLVAPFRWEVLLWVAVAMVTARSAAMGFNRIVDRRIDAKNPRTAARELPQGRISLPAAWVFVVGSSALFFLSAWMLNPLCGWLSPIALAILFFYSLTKRFTWTSQFWLGLSLAISPVGAWMAMTGSLDLRILPMAAAVLLWVGGFDVFYACLDYEFDKTNGLHSMPVRFGLRGAVWIARAMHAVAAALLLWTHWLFALGPGYLIGVAITIIILAVEDFIVRSDDLSLAMLAFNLNGGVSIIYFFAVIAGLVWR